MKPRHLLLTLAILLSPAASQAAECSEECQLAQVRAYFAQLDAVMRKGSSAADVDALFRLFDEDVKYQHIEYGADFDRAAWKEAFLRNLENGSYNRGPQDQIRILTTIPGGSHLAVEYAYGRRDANGEWTQDGDGLLVLFGFRDDKIVLVREYWK